MRPAPAEARRFPNKKKDTHRWCHGKVGREHTPQLKIDARRIWPPSGHKSCHESSYTINGRRVWDCYHVLTCTDCGKILKHIVDCPNKPGDIEQFPSP